MKKKKLVGIIFLFLLLVVVPRNNVRASSPTRDWIRVFRSTSLLGMEYYGEEGCPLNDFTVMDEYYDIYTYDEDDPMWLPPGGGNYMFARTITTGMIVDYSVKQIPEGWSVSGNEWPATELYITVPDNVQKANGYVLRVEAEVYDLDTWEYIATAQISMTIDVAVYTSDCTITILDAETNQPIQGALIDGEMGYLVTQGARKLTNSNGQALFQNIDTYMAHTRDITIEATGYETLTTVVETEQDEENITRTYKLTPRSKTGELIIGVWDVFEDLQGVDVHVSNGRLIDAHLETDRTGTAWIDMVNPGTYHMVISEDGYQTIELDVEMPENGKNVTVERQLVHNQVGTLTLHIKDSSGEALTKAKADIRGATFEAEENGTLLVENLPLNEYIVTIYNPGYQAKKKRIYFKNTMETTVYLDSISGLSDMGNYEKYHNSIDAGWNHSVCIDDENRAYGIGNNEYGQLTGTEVVTEQKYIVDNVCSVEAGTSHTIFLKKDGTVWATGRNRDGQLGDGTKVNKSVLTQVTGLSNIIQISSYGDHNLALQANGTVWAWGDNDNGQLGDETTVDKTVPIQVNITEVVQVVAGYDYSYFLKSDGTVYGVGSNNWGRLGQGMAENKYLSFIQITPLTDIQYVAGGYYHGMAVDKKGVVYGWGYNANGQMGLNTAGIYLLPTQMPYLSNIKTVTCGYGYTLYVDVDGNIYQSGYVSASLIPEGYTTKDIMVPFKLEMENISCVSGNTYIAIAHGTDGTIWRWGTNTDGQLGDGTTIGSAEPIQFPSEKALTNNIQAETAYDLALDSTTTTKHVSICKGGENRYYRFVAPRTGMYTIQSLSTEEDDPDPYGYLLDNTLTVLESNDDAPYGYDNPDNYHDFYISRELQAGHTYYIKARVFSTSLVHEYDLRITCPTQTSNSVKKADNPKLYDALKANKSTLDSENTGTITASELETLSGTLFLSRRGITDVTGLDSCTNIDQLYLDGNKLTNIDAISELTNLKTLDVSANQLTDISAVAGMEHLKVLNAARNQITDIQGVTGLKHMKYLYLEDNALTDISEVGTNPKLRHITLQNNAIGSIEGIDRCTELNQLNLSGNENVTHLKPLEHLWNLQDIRLTDTAVTTLDRLPNNLYEHVYVNGCTISEEEKERIENQYTIGNVVY